MYALQGLFVHRSFTEVMLRVCARIIELDYRKNPHLYEVYPPQAVDTLSDAMRFQFPELYPFLQYYARNMGYGYKLHELRDNPPEYTLRSIAKLKPRLPRPS